jgi:hypothetical protein
MSQVGCGIIENGGNFFRTAIMGRLPSDSKRFFH